MITTKNNSEFYQELLLDATKAYATHKKKYQFIGSLRLLVFSTIALSLFFFWGNSLLYLPLSIFILLFFYFISVSLQVKYKRDKNKELMRIIQSEIAVLNGDWSAFNDGEIYKSSQHAYSLDMDLFGKKSVFQLINRTRSKAGSDLLAEHLLSGSSELELNKIAIEELSTFIPWCQEFMAEAIVLKSDDDDKHLHAIDKVTCSLSLTDQLLRFIHPVIAIGGTICYQLDWIPTSVYTLLTFLLFALIGRNFKKANTVIAHVTSYSTKIQLVQRQLTLVQHLSFKHPELVKFQQQLIAEDGCFGALNDLKKVSNGMEFRMNLFVGTILNFFLAWDLQCIHRWNNWQSKWNASIPSWESKLARMEVWISLAVYHYNFPATHFASIQEGTKIIELLELGHPFVGAKKCVTNDFVTRESENFQIITGPNMAGKSTFLRSVGLAILFANAGFPVYAKRCVLPRLKLYTSMRTTDDLTVESSYFHAELTRLRFIMDAVENGEPIFVILDEILKGTNSTDKEIGSKKFLSKLNRLNTKGIIATHDLALCELANDSIHFRNQYFDSTITGDDIFFDYTIKDGICQNMNASFLLKKMALIDG